MKNKKQKKIIKMKIIKLSDNKRKAIKQINKVIRMPYGDKSTPYQGLKSASSARKGEVGKK